METQSDNLAAAPVMGPVRQASPRTVTTYLTWLVIVLIVVVAVLIFVSMAAEPQAPRTSAERDLARFEELVKKNPRDAGVQAGMAAALAQVGSYEQAIGRYKVAIKLKAQPQYFVALAEAYQVTGNTEEAVKTARLAQKLNEKFVGGWFVEGKIFFDQGQYDKALAPLYRSVDLEPGASDIHYLIGQSLEQLGKTKAAADEYQKALQFLPDYQEALDALEKLGVKPDKLQSRGGLH